MLRLEPEKFRNKLIGLLTDNPAAANTVRRLRGASLKLQAIAEQILHELTNLGSKFTSVEHVLGSTIPLADALSRHDMAKFYALHAAGARH